MEKDSQADGDKKDSQADGDKDVSERTCRIASKFLKRCSQSARLWHSLISCPSVAKRLRQSLQAEVKRDTAFAQILATMSTEFVEGKKKKRKAKLVEVIESAWPPKVRRRLRYKQGPNGLWLIKGVGLLNINLMSSVLSFVDLSTKLAAMRVGRGFHEVLQCGDAWDPLVMNRFQCQGMLRFVRASWFSASRLREDCKWKFCRLPPAFHQVSVLDIDLMDAERSVRDQSDTEDEERRPIPLTIVSPLREFSRGWRSFTRIASLTLRNIDYYSMGYDFLHFRCICLKSFGFVKLHYTGNRTYRLEASAEREPPVVNCREVALMNSNRLPASTRVQATTLSEREALFLLEHPTSYKNGNDIRFIHDVNLINSHSVRKQYKPLVESLKERFPTFRPT